MANSESTLNDLIRRTKDSIRNKEVSIVKDQEFLSGLETELEQVKRKRVSESSGDTRTLLNG